MTFPAWWPVALVWIIAVVIAAVLWQRYTRAPAIGVPSSGATPRTRRVVPVWLALVYLILLVVAIWVTLAW